MTIHHPAGHRPSRAREMGERMPRSRKPKPHKIVEGLKEAIAQAAAQPQEPSAYDKLAERVLTAVGELNSALQAAHEMSEMRVYLLASPYSRENAMRFEVQIYRMSHATLTMTVKVAGEPGATHGWQQVKDPAYQDAAGAGFFALNKKRA